MLRRREDWSHGAMISCSLSQDALDNLDKDWDDDNCSIRSLMPSFKMIRRKLVIAGDGASGKTSILLVFSKEMFPSSYIPTVFDNYVTGVEVNQPFLTNSKIAKGTKNLLRKISFKDKSGKRQLALELWDTAGQEDFIRVRSLSYKNADVVLLCFSLDSSDSLKNVVEKWAPEVKYYCPDVPIILVGNKKDLRTVSSSNETDKENLRSQMVSNEEGKSIARQINAVSYVECSAKTGDGIKMVFEKATFAALRRKKKGTCILQ